MLTRAGAAGIRRPFWPRWAVSDRTNQHARRLASPGVDKAEAPARLGEGARHTHGPAARAPAAQGTVQRRGPSSAGPSSAGAAPGAPPRGFVAPRFAGWDACPGALARGQPRLATLESPLAGTHVASVSGHERVGRELSDLSDSRCATPLRFTKPRKTGSPHFELSALVDISSCSNGGGSLRWSGWAALETR